MATHTIGSAEVTLRVIGGTKAIIVDIDGTLVNGSTPNQPVIDYVRKTPGRVIIVTGRDVSQRDKTTELLDRIGVTYSALYMYSGTAAVDDYKRLVAKKLLERYDITQALDDNADNRAAYASLGIPVMHPADVQQRASETYRPPKGVREEAQRALQWIKEGHAGDGFTDVGRKRAADLAAGRALSADTVLRMYSYLSRHEVDKQGSGFSPGEDGYPSPGRVAWAAWGGDPGLDWSRRIRDQLVQRHALLEVSMQTRALPPSYRPAASEDVPCFTPSCASCCFFELRADGGHCAKWDDGCDPQGYCDAWIVNEDALPTWMCDDQVEEYSASPAVETRATAANQPTADALTALIEDVFGFYTRAHEAHWNVTGSDFVEYHALFGEIYQNVWESVDEYAENIRKLGSLAPSLAVESRDLVDVDPALLAQQLLDVNEALIPALRDAFDIATAAGQQGIANFLAERQDAHQRISWQLRTSLGVAEVSEARKAQWNGAETRSIPAELRAETAADGTITVRGYAAVFDEEATGLPFREVIKPGAFARSLQRGDDVFLLVNHDTDQLPLARRSSGTLQLSEDGRGLLIEAQLDPANPRAAEVASVLARNDASQMSFAFKVAEGGSRKTKDGLRELSDLDLFEVSIVTWPAYAQTEVGLRSASATDRVRLARARHRQLLLAS
jgi:HK97 family phage prohead protease